MRFLLKSAFWLGLVAFLLPFGGGARDDGTEPSLFGALVGAQQALQDVSGFCSRAPQACESGREIAVFAGERIGDGVALAYDFIDKRHGAPGEVSIAVADDAEPLPAPVTATDPIRTGTVAAEVAALPAAGQPQAYRAPMRDAPAAGRSSAGMPGAPEDVPFVPRPTPAPRA